jgi:hypothetical protein
MKDIFFNQVDKFLMAVIFYILLYRLLYSRLVKNSGGYHNVFAMILTAIIMTSFELGFIWINYYYSFNNEGANIIDRTTQGVADTIRGSTTTTTAKAVGNKVGFFSQILYGMAGVDNKKVNTINMFANVAGLLLVFMLILILLLTYTKGKCEGFALPNRVIYASVSTALCLIIFFGFFFFSTSAVYEMVPNKFDVLKMARKVLADDTTPLIKMTKTKFPTGVKFKWSDVFTRIMVWSIILVVLANSGRVLNTAKKFF